MFFASSAKVAVLVVSPTRELALQIHREVHREELRTDHQPEIFNMRSFTICGFPKNGGIPKWMVYNGKPY